MQILFWILEFLLVSLLVILGIVVVLLGVLLLAPIRYQIYFEKYDKLAYEISFRFLYGIRGYFKLEDGKREEKVKVFFKVLHEEENNEEVQGIKRQDEHNIELKRKKKSTKCIKKTPNVTKAPSKELTSDREQKNKNIQKHKSKEVTKQEPKKVTRMDWTILKERWTYSAIKEMILLIKNIVLAIKPKSFSFEVVIGEEDPADTGELIAKLTMLYPLYYKYGVIRGEYERSCKQGGFFAEGKFRIGTLVRCLIKFFTKKSVRKMIKYIMKR